MKVLFLDAYFNPEIIAFTHLENDIIDALINHGHEINIICPTPTRGIDRETAKEYRHIKYESLFDGKVNVERFWAPQENKNPVTRAFRYFWCNFRQYQIGKKYKDTDVIFSASTPPTQGLLMAKLKRKLKCPTLYSLQDVFPDSLVNAKITREGSLIYRIGRKIENYSYKNADKIIVISEGIKKNLLAKGVEEEKLCLVSNWIDMDSVQPVERKDNTITGEFGIDKDKFLVVYAGNFGAAQGADIILKVAKELQDKSDIQFVIFGGGAYFEAAKKEASTLSNVFIHSLLPQERVSEVYSLGDICLITCKKGTGSAGLPSKTWSIMACNTPIIASFDTDSDLADVLLTSGAGECVEAGDVSLLRAAIEKRYTAWKNGGEDSSNLREYVRENASKEICAEKYAQIIENL